MLNGSWLMSMVDPLPLNLTISHWNQSLRRALQIHLPSCCACSYACKGMIKISTTTLVMEIALPHTLSHFKPITWPCDCIGYCHMPYPPIPCLRGSPPTGFWEGCWDVCPSWYNHLWLAWWHQGSPTCPVCPYWQHCESLTVEDGLVFHVEKTSSSLHQKGRMSLVLYTNHTKVVPKHSCLPMVVSSGLVSTRPFEEAVWQCETCMMISGPECCCTTHTDIYTFTSLDRYVHQTFSHWMVWITSSLLISIPR